MEQGVSIRMRRPKIRSYAICAIFLLLSVGCVSKPDGNSVQKELVAALEAQDILRLPLEQGAVGYDRVAQALRSVVHFKVLRQEPPILKAAGPITLTDGIVVSDVTVEDYKGQRKLSLAFDSDKCFPLAQVAGITDVEIAKTLPQEHDDEHGRTFTTKRNGMLAVVSTAGPGSECVGSIVLAQSGA
ncbi:hypothetical protein [Lysobacter enzymogenes]|uniref:hypothetical protein n=1 Tax=Lysobacter enzymogenes TaxID=69 RepID=UPI00111729EA|nr:hypothetical protein [Lysobacter enzymogenes]UZW61173.1 hypothetical protein BV903_002435 [Lysobacter enzymogenes]